MMKTLNIDSVDPTHFDYAVESKTPAVVVWAPPWQHLEPEQGKVDETLWEKFDTQVRLANERKLLTYVSVGSVTPLWACQKQIGNKPTPQGRSWRLAPDDRSTTGPWGRYLSQVLERHPRVQGIAVINETNAGFMDGGAAARHSAEMLRSAADIWRKSLRNPLLMGPATWSGPGSVQFTNQVLAELRKTPNWKRGSVKFVWAHHHYNDVASGGHAEVKAVLDLLAGHKITGGLWLTEGGYQFPTHQDPNPDYHADPKTWHYNEPVADHEKKQNDLVVAHFKWCEAANTVKMWANYEVQDSMWGGWASGFVRNDGTPRLLHATWKNL